MGEEVGAFPDGKLLDLRLDLAADRHRAGPLALGELAHLGDQRIGVDPPQLRLVHVDRHLQRRRDEHDNRRGRPDQRARRYLAIEDDAVDRGDDLRLADSELRQLDRRLCLIDRGLRGLDILVGVRVLPST